MNVVPESTLQQQIAAELVALVGVTDLRAEGTAEQIAGALGRRLFSGQATMLQNRNDGYYGLASGVGLDDLLSDVLPDGLLRAVGARASGGAIVFTRPTADSLPALTIPAGTPLTRSSDGARYVLIADAVIAADKLDSTEAGGSGPISVVAQNRGASYNVEVGDIDSIATRVSTSALSVSNTAPIANGTDRETDDDVRASLRSYVRTIAAGTPAAILKAVRDFEDATYGRVKFAEYVPGSQPGYATIYIDDGAGGYNSYGTTTLVETLLASASGGETRLYLAHRPLRSIPIVYVNSAPTAYRCVKTTGMVELSTPLTAGNAVRAETYTYYTGMVALIQAAIDGNPSDIEQQPGVSAGAVFNEVKPATRVGSGPTGYLLVSAEVTVDDVSVKDDLYTALRAAIAAKINSLPIENGTGNGYAYRSMIVALLKPGEAGSHVINVTNVKFDGAAADKYPSIGQVLRTTSTYVTLT